MRRLWILLLLPLVASAASRGLWAPDEPRYAEVAREVFVEPGLVVMRLCGDLYPDKPPLLFWLAGLFGRLSGWSPFAMRLVSIAAMVGAALLIARLARRWWGEREAALAPAMFLGTAMVTEIGGRLQIDPLLCFLVTAAVFLFDGIGDDPERGAVGHRAKRRLAGLALGLGMLAKGPVAVLIVALVLLAWRLVPSARGEARSQAGRRLDMVTVSLVVAPAALWAAAAIWSEPALKGPLLFGQHLGRLTDGGGGNHWAPFWQHLETLPLLALPWTPALLFGLALAWRAVRGRTGGLGAGEGADRGLVRAALWFGVLFLFFSIIPPKRNLYLLPAYPAIALLSARAWTALDLGRGARLMRLATPLVVLVLGLALAGAGLASGSLAAHDPKVAEALAELPELATSLTWRLPLGALPLLLGGAAGLTLLLRGRRAPDAAGQPSARLTDRAAAATLSGWALGAAALFVLLFPGIDHVKSAERVAGLVGDLHRAHPSSAIPCMGLKPEGFRFYAGVPTVAALSHADLESETLPPPGPLRNAHVLDAWAESLGPSRLAIVGRPTWDALPEETRARFGVLLEDRLGGKELVVLGSP